MGMLSYLPTETVFKKTTPNHKISKKKPLFRAKSKEELEKSKDLILNDTEALTPRKIKLKTGKRSSTKRKGSVDNNNYLVKNPNVLAESYLSKHSHSKTFNNSKASVTNNNSTDRSKNDSVDHKNHEALKLRDYSPGYDKNSLDHIKKELFIKQH